MAEPTTQNASLALYNYLCWKIIGTEEHVKTMRMMNNVRDHLHSDKKWTTITSGSFGEGLGMKGSDLDMMTVVKLIEVCENTHMNLNADKIHFTMEMVDTKPGFTKLRLMHSSDQSIIEFCAEIGSEFYFSNLLFKQALSTDILSTVHGPCVSDEHGNFDLAYCLYSQLWISPATPWITRSNHSWPRYDVKQDIVNHGVLFVPVGVKGSVQEELEWRISFSVGEKLLIHTFTHTQLLCYALMKIIQKDVISLDIDCKELICSYFMKTVLFWICEELPSAEWKPENLISCYMRCFRRLIYCVEYGVCPHYFIPENNLFENKIQGQAQKTLLNKLNILNSYGWQCILLSDQFSEFRASSFYVSKQADYLHVSSIEKLLTNTMFAADIFHLQCNFLLEKVIYKVLFSNSSKIKNLYTYYISKYIFESSRLLPFDDVFGNKSIYKLYTSYIRFLLLSTRHDAVSGWLMLASFFYRIKQFNTTLYIVQYALLKCTPEKLYHHMIFSDISYGFLNLHLFKKITIVQLWRFLYLNLVIFTPHSTLIPDELQIELQCRMPPVAYAHFLCFLCHYHLKNSRQYRDDLRHLQLTITENYVIANTRIQASSINLLGIIFELLGDIESARQAFMQSIEKIPDQRMNSAFQRLSLIN